jgi:hypothetical protein
VSTRPWSVVVDAADPGALAGFWADALQWQVTLAEPDEVVVEPGPDGPGWADGGPPPLVFVPVDDPKSGKNRVHLDLVSTSDGDQQARVGHLLGLGARRVDIGQAAVPWVVLADPEGNELCVLDPREDYRDARGVAAVVLDCADPTALSAFWSAATGWPVASAAPAYARLRQQGLRATALELLAVPDPKRGKNRLHIDVAPRPGDDMAAEVARLEAGGARRIDVGQRDVTWVVLADPEDNELCVLTPR